MRDWNGNNVDLYTVGWFDAGTDLWYFAGEYGTFDAAKACADKVFQKKQLPVRVTDITTGNVTYKRTP